jgi:hypothetical protein
MGKICLYSGGTAVTLLGSYAAAAANTSGYRWYLGVLLALSIWAGIAFLVSGAIYIINLVRGTEQKRARLPMSSLYDVIPILQRMHDRNMELSKEQIDLKLRYDIITEDYIDYFGYKLKLSDLEVDTSRITDELETHLDKNFPKGIFDIGSSQIMLMGAKFECMGLKNNRRNDTQFENLNRELDIFRNKVTDIELNTLIQLHIFTSNFYSVMPFIHKMPDGYKQELMRKLPQKLRIQFHEETMEDAIKEDMNEIRVKIGKRIKELERLEAQNERT